jgi:hypothetical protein
LVVIDPHGYAYREVRGLLVSVERPVKRLDEDLLNVRTGEPLAHLHQLAEIERLWIGAGVVADAAIPLPIALDRRSRMRFQWNDGIAPPPLDS